MSSTLFAKATLIASLCLSASGKRPLSEPNALLASIDRNGAAAVVKELTSGDEMEWHRVIRKIDMGSSPWLAVANKLLTAADAGGTEDLYISLAVALTHNPSGVLSMVGPHLSIEQVCTVPFIEPDSTTVREHKRKVRAALRSVTVKVLSSRKADCLKAIAK